MHWRIGVDENGLGPQLGPLVVTAVLARLSDAATHRMDRDPSLLMHERLADSKQLVAHDDIAIGEAWARAMVCKMTGRRPSCRDDVLDALALRPKSDLRRWCPPHVEPQCWARVLPFVASDTALERAEQDLAALGRAGVDVVWARSEIACTRRLNDALATGRSRLVVDLAAMEELVLAARDHAGDDLLAVCGKVGGMRSYPSRFGPMGGKLHATLTEDAAISSYRVAGVGEVRFVRDADATDPLVALASLIGKYVREDLMSRVVEHYRIHNPALPNASGYHDPVTDRFIEGTVPYRRALGVPDTCFLRERRAKAAT